MEKTERFIKKCQYLIDTNALEYVHCNFIDLYQKCMESEEFLNDFGKDYNENRPNLITDMETNLLNAIENINIKIDKQNSMINSLELFKNLFNQTTKLIASSPELGIKGESDIINLLHESFPTFEILNAAETNHSGDIIMVDHRNNIKYVFEIKNKQSITANDVSKFINDVETMTDEFYKIYGIFISLNTENIPYKGSYLCENNLFYLSKKYVSKEILTIIINHLIPIKENIGKVDENIIKHSYEIDVDKLNLVLNIKKQFSEMKELHQILNDEIKNNNATRINLLKMKDSVESYLYRLEDLSKTFTLNHDEMDIAKQCQIDSMKEYIRNKSKTFKKDDLKKEFPLCLAIILEKKVDELRKWAMG